MKEFKCQITFITIITVGKWCPSFSVTVSTSFKFTVD